MYDHMKYMYERTKAVHDNVRGIYIKLSDVYDTLEIICHIFTRLHDKRSKVHIKSINRQYIFHDEGLEKDVFRFNKFFDFLHSCLFYEHLSFVIFPSDTVGYRLNTYREFTDSKSFFACKCWDYKNVIFLFKNLEEFELAYGVCKNYLFDDYRIITDANIGEMGLEYI